MTRRWAAAAAALTLAACGGVAAGPGSATGDPVSGTLTVLAATSLTDAFKQEAAGFQEAHPRIRVETIFAGSPTLVMQIEQGAPADVFASADQPNMQRLVDSGMINGRARVFATNQLQIVVGAGNPKHISGLAELSNPNLIVLLAAPEVPAGRYAGQALARAGVKVTPRSLETDVKAVVGKVALGEADAGIVYTTDVTAGGPRVAGVAIPDSQNVVVSYPIAVVRDAKNDVAGRAWIDYTLSARGQSILTGLGFGRP